MGERLAQTHAQLSEEEALFDDGWISSKHYDVVSVGKLLSLLNLRSDGEWRRNGLLVEIHAVYMNRHSIFHQSEGTYTYKVKSFELPIQETRTVQHPSPTSGNLGADERVLERRS